MPPKFPLILALFSSVWLTQSADAEPFQHEFGELREYHKHWLAVCPNKFQPSSTNWYLRQCWVSTYTGKAGFFLQRRLSVTRDRVTGEQAVTVIVDGYEKIEKVQPVVARFSNGSSFQFAYGKSFKQSKHANEFQLTIENTGELLTNMKQSNWMTLTIPLKSGPQVSFYSMIGLTSALAFTKKYSRPAK